MKKCKSEVKMRERESEREGSEERERERGGTYRDVSDKERGRDRESEGTE